MDLGAYRPVLANRDTRQALLLGFLIRVPMWAGAVILTLHVVTSLGRSYGEAGLVTAASTVAVAVSVCGAAGCSTGSACVAPSGPRSSSRWFAGPSPGWATRR